MYGSLFLLLGLIACGCGENATEYVKAPVEFPRNESDYNLIQNNTILDKLNNHEMFETELEDMARGGTPSPADEKLAGDLFTKENFKTMMPAEDPKQETELIQTGNNEDGLFKERQATGNAEGQRVPVVQGQVAAILAGVFVLIAAIGYAGLLTWRRYLENRYGSRDLLVNDDMGHFSL